jgi:purine-nucleoside phosphorylase
MSDLKSLIETAFEQRADITPKTVSAEVKQAVEQVLSMLDNGSARVAEKITGEWVVHQWLKKAVLLSFRINDNEVMDGAENRFFDKVPMKYAGYTDAQFRADGVRIVPPAAVRRGSYIGKNVVVMQGRFHFYEGYDMQKVVFPVRVMKLLGIEYLFISNASGGINPEHEIGDVMVLNDHINLFPSNPLIGANYKDFGPRFPDMSEPYDKSLIKKAFDIAAENGFKVHQGLYVGVSGPCFETPDEYKYMRNIGGDAVGMSTVPEVIAGRHMSIPCFAVSVITDLGVEGKIVEVSHEEVIKAAGLAENKMLVLFKNMLAGL